MTANDDIIKDEFKEGKTNQNTNIKDKSNPNIFSAESQTLDYTSVKGIRTRIGLQENDFGIFLIKEKIDNALDFIEKNCKKFIEINQNPYIHVIITEEKNELIETTLNTKQGKDTPQMVTKIKVTNSNAGIDNIFPDYQINQIFDFSKYYSSKRHRYQISRGALGDAFKAILGIPYAIAINNEKNLDDNNKTNWNYPLQINISNKKLIDIIIDNLDKIRRKNHPDIDINIQYTAKDENLQHTNGNQSQNHFTEIITYIPGTLDRSDLWSLLIKYALINPHIEFKFEIPDKSNNKTNQSKVYSFKATQKLNDWKNNQSIYYYSLSEFKELIYSIEEASNNLNVYDNLIYTTFREGRILKKDNILERLTIGELKSDENKIEYVYLLLRQAMKSKKYQSKSQSLLEVPFSIKQNTRREALKERFEQLFEVDDFNYRRIDGYYEDPDRNDSSKNKIEFPFILEIAIVNSPSFVKKLHMVSAINSSPSLWSNAFLDESGEEIFTWESNNKRSPAHSIITILEDCGYFYSEKKHRKSNNFVIINLISPRIDYKSHNKLNIDLKPFADIIAKNLYKIAKSSNRNNKTDDKSSIIDELRSLLRERLEEVNKDPSLKIKDRWTQSTVFYRVRPRLIAKGLKVKREYITGKIRTICENEFGKKREELGIIAADRAQLYFDGRSFDVGLDELEELMKKGTDLIVIEKEGVADVLAPFAKNYGIAILNSRGFPTEYATDLSTLAEEQGCNIAVLSDLDSSGLVIASKLPDSYRIGIDLWTLSYFGLNREEVEEEVIIEDKNKKQERDNHLKKLKQLKTIPLSYVGNIDEWNRLVSYVSTKKRIEIDSVLAKVGIEKFWNFVIDELKREFPYRNYNRAIDVPKYVLPKEIEDFNLNLENIFTEICVNEQSKIQDELESTTEFFVDVAFKNEEIHERLEKVIYGNDRGKRIISEFKKFNELINKKEEIE